MLTNAIIAYEIYQYLTNRGSSSFCLLTPCYARDDTDGNTFIRKVMPLYLVTCVTTQIYTVSYGYFNTNIYSQKIPEKSDHARYDITNKNHMGKTFDRTEQTNLTGGVSSRTKETTDIWIISI